MHFKNDLSGELNLSTLDEITFKNAAGEVIINMKKDTFYSNHVGTFFKNKGTVKGGEAIEYSFKTDSSYITYYFSISQSQDRKYKYSYYRERLKGEKEVKWVGDLITTYRRDFLILEYKPLQYAIDNKHAEFAKIIKLDSSLLKHPFDGRYQ
jgi:hypothetical protein